MVKWQKSQITNRGEGFIDMKKINRVDGLEKKYIEEVLDNQFSSKSSYQMVTRLEKEFANKFGVKHAIAMVNGTATLHIALEVVGVGIGDEVICPPLTMSSTSLAVLHANGIPVFADVDKESFLINPESIEEKITDKTKAIIIVALFGLCPDMDSIMEIAEKHHLVVIEDNAQCFLAKYRDRMAGEIGHMASFSFQSSKQMTCGEGGILITNDSDMALKIRRYSGLGYAGISSSKGRITKDDIQDPDYERHAVLGWNYRMSDLCGAVALAQLERLDELVEMRKIAAQHFLKVIRKCSWLKEQKVALDCECVYWAVAVLLDTDEVEWHDFRNKYIEFGGDGIYAAWKLSYLEPAYRNHHFLGRENLIEQFGEYEYKEGICPTAECIQPKLLQFKTNYWDENIAVEQAKILEKTIEYFEGKL